VCLFRKGQACGGGAGKLYKANALRYSRWSTQEQTRTQHRFRIYYESREPARELDDSMLGVVEAASAEDAVRKAGRHPEILRRAMPCSGLWAVRAREGDEGKAPLR
jgi:hypothetical protein